MNLSDKHRKIIDRMEADGYIWLSHMNINAQQRFRNMTRKGFKGYVKIGGEGTKSGLTFLTKSVANVISFGSASNAKPLRKFEQLELAIQKIADLEAEIYRLKGVGAKAEMEKADED